MEKALATAGCEANVTWLPFQLRPNFPAKSVNKLIWYKQAFGEDRVRSMVPHMKQVGASCGIKFSYGGRVGNTFLSHRLVELARQQGKQDAMVNILFSAYFEEEADISEASTLMSLASEAKVEGATQEFFDSSQCADRVREDLRRVGSLGVTGVPHFLIEYNGKKFQIPGAQDEETWLSVFHRLGATSGQEPAPRI